MIRQAAQTFAGFAALFLLLGSPAAAVPIEVSFYAEDGSAYGEFAFERRPTYNTPAKLSGGELRIGDRIITAEQMFYEYYPILDSLAVWILADETSGLDAGDFVTLRFGNLDGADLILPTRGQLGYSFGGVRDGVNGTVTAVPEPLSVTLFGAAAGALVWRRRRSAPNS